MFSESEIKEELKKSIYLRTWGRDVVFAIDKDDPIKHFEKFYKKIYYVNFVKINEQASRWNYGGYAWTPYMHEYQGIFIFDAWFPS